MNRIGRALIIWLCLAVLAPAFAKETPEAVYRRFEAAVKAQGMSAIADYLHPDELARFKGMVEPALTDPALQSEGDRKMMQALFGPDATPAAIKAMPPRDFVLAVMRMVDRRTRHAGVTLGRGEVLGAVPEKDLVHLVVRMSGGAAEVQITQLEVVSLKQHGETWRLMLSGKIEGFAEALRNRKK